MSSTNLPASPRTLGDLMRESGVAFGTSGARGLVSAMTDAVCFAYAFGYLKYLAEIGEFVVGSGVALAGDLRPSSARILAACSAAVHSAGGVPVFCGYVPSPCLALYAYTHAMPSLMVTGSHIPDDRNGIKFNRPHGELLKSDEPGMLAQTVVQPDGFFDARGSLLTPPQLSVPHPIGAAYLERYRAFFGTDALRGRHIGVYQHSAVGRDLLVEVLEALGARVSVRGRSAVFVPVDTEAIRPEDVAFASSWAAEEALDAIVSTDGDSDRPLLADERGVWMRGDVLGVLCARYLSAQVVVTPVSSNTALEKSAWFDTCVRTRIGSPFVVSAMQQALQDGRAAVCGYEANGGFLLASPVERAARTLAALPTRDAFLPILAALVSAAEQGRAVSTLPHDLPPRFTHSDRLPAFPLALSRGRLADLQQGDEAQQRAAFANQFGVISGTVSALDHTDGLRATFDNAEVIHLRPSGNAPELRCYTEAASEARATAINAEALALLAQWRHQ